MVGSVHDWDWYLEGQSTVEVSSPKEIVDWLRCCKYMGDTILFHERDFWQHPVTFENMRKGDRSRLPLPHDVPIGRSPQAVLPCNVR